MSVVFTSHQGNFLFRQKPPQKTKNKTNKQTNKQKHSLSKFRVVDPSPSKDFYKTNPSWKAQGTLGKRGWEEL